METSWLSELWALAKQAGPFATLLMFFFWWRTESERRTLQDSHNQLLERVLNAMNSATNAVASLNELFKGKGQ